MTKETTDEPVVTETEDDGTVDLQGLVGGILDERGFTAERSQRLDLLDGLESRMLDAFKASGGTNPATTQPAQFDEAGFIGRIEAIIDAKLGGNIKPESPPENRGAESTSRWLGRWLGL